MLSDAPIHIHTGISTRFSQRGLFRAKKEKQKVRLAGTENNVKLRYLPCQPNRTLQLTDVKHTHIHLPVSNCSTWLHYARDKYYPKFYICKLSKVKQHTNCSKLIKINSILAEVTEQRQLQKTWGWGQEMPFISSGCFQRLYIT